MINEEREEKTEIYYGIIIENDARYQRRLWRVYSHTVCTDGTEQVNSLYTHMPERRLWKTGKSVQTANSVMNAQILWIAASEWTNKRTNRRMSAQRQVNRMKGVCASERKWAKYPLRFVCSDNVWKSAILYYCCNFSIKAHKPYADILGTFRSSLFY